MSRDSHLHALRSHLQRTGIIHHGDGIVVAVSGGMDSVVLMDMLDKLKKEWKLSLALAHVNYQLRANESDEDESFVRSVAEHYGLECYVEHVDGATLAEERKQSIQEVARDVRYAFFAKLRTSLGFQRIATAHHANDNAETLLFNFIRGSGVQGMSGIPSLRKDLSVVRPLIGMTQAELREYAVTHKLPYRVDSSNAKTEYTRNFLRKELIPIIEENINPNFVRTMRRTSELFQELQDYLQDHALRVVQSITLRNSAAEIAFDVRLLRQETTYLQEYILLKTAREFSRSEIDYTTVRAMFDIAHGETGDHCSISGNVVVHLDRDQLVFLRTRAPRSYQYEIELNTAYDFQDFRFEARQVDRADFSEDASTEFVDGASLGSGLHLRPWMDGDTFIPLGMKQKKKVSDFFIDEKIPLYVKHTIPLLVSDAGIIWICGQRLDHRHRVVSSTSNIIQLHYQSHAPTS